MSHNADPVFEVFGSKKGFSVTYRCTTPFSALRQHGALVARHYTNIVVTDPTGATLTGDELRAQIEQMTEADGGAIDLDASQIAEMARTNANV